MNDEARRFWEMATSSPWVNLVLMFIGIFSIVAVAWVFVTHDFTGAISTYIILVFGAWFVYVMSLCNQYQIEQRREVEKRIWDTLRHVKQSEGWNVDISAPNNIVIRYPDGHAFFFEIEEVKEVEA